MPQFTILILFYAPNRGLLSAAKKYEFEQAIVTFTNLILMLLLLQSDIQIIYKFP